jgi:hypothetical protein
MKSGGSSSAQRSSVVEVEALVEAEAPCEDERRHEGSRVVAGAADPFGERHGLVAEREVAVVAHAVGRGVEAGHDRAVGGEGDGGDGRGVRATDALVGQAVDRRGVRQPEAVAAEAVGPQRVDGDQEDVRARPVAAAGERSDCQRD